MIMESYDNKKRAAQLAIIGIIAAWIVYDTRNSMLWGRVLSKVPLLLTGNVNLWPIQGGFALNIFISLVSIAIASVLGVLLAMGMLANAKSISLPSFWIMNFFRNSPWLVVLFSMLYLLPFEISFLGMRIAFPPAAKAIIGLSLPVAANLAEVIRGAVQSIHGGQWESARALGYGTLQIYRHVILPQAIKRMIPGWVTLYALLTLATSVATVTGVQDVITILRQSLATENERALLYFYFAVMLMFFAYCYPIALLARRLERNLKGHAI
jgi:polar amino acid transport system permease protein